MCARICHVQDKEINNYSNNNNASKNIRFLSLYLQYSTVPNCKGVKLHILGKKPSSSFNHYKGVT